MKTPHSNELIDHYMKKMNEEIKTCREIKEGYERRIKELNVDIKIMELNKAKYCESNGGHTWISEREDGMYGEVFTTCKECGKEGY